MRYLFSLFTAFLLLAFWIFSLPFLWVAGRCFSRAPHEILFWTNEGFRMAPSRVRSYRFAEECNRMGTDASVLSFWDHIEHFTGLPPYYTTPQHKVLTAYRGLLRGVRSRAGIIVVQRPMYDVASVVSLKLLYGRAVKIWIDVDDWIFMYNLFPGRININFRHTVPLLAAVSEGCIVAGLHLEQELKKYFDRVEIIPTFVDANKFVPNNETSVKSSSSQVVFSWVGTLFEPAVIEDILFIADALNSLQDRRAVLEIVGDGEHRPIIENKVAALTDTLSVHFLGWLEPDSMPDYLTSIDVGLYCLRTQTDFTRSKSPTKLFEYMACAKPTVSTDFGEAPRFIEHGVTGFLAKEKDDFVECCRRLVDDPELRAIIGRNARRKIEEEYNLQAGTKRLSQILLGD